MRLSPRLPDPTDNVNVSKGSPLKDFVVMLGTLALGLGAVYLLLGLAVDFTVPRLSPQMERRIASALAVNHPLLKHSRPAPQAVRDLAERTRMALGTVDGDVDVRVWDKGMVNAFALPGRTIVLTTGMLSTLEYENELVFVLGHEMGHIAARDHLRGLGRGLVLVALSEVVLGDSGGLSDLLTGMLQLTNQSFSRGQETRADESGLTAMDAVYGHVGGLSAVFEHLGDTDYDTLTEFTLSHPESSKRIAALRELIARRGYAERTPLDLPESMR